jgi:hypothetical protein
MKRIRLSTLLLVVVIAALTFALVEQRWRAARREAILEAKLAEASEVVADHYALGIIHIANDKVVTKQRK